MTLRLGKIWQIPIGLHISWFLIFGLLTWSLATTILPEEFPEMSVTLHWVAGVITSILFFGSVLLHELGHAFEARRCGIPVKRITLFLFGGVAQIEREPETAVSEFRIAIAGPFISLLLAGFFYLLWLIVQNIAWLAAPSLWLARINLLLGAFNLIPGFPLDGGRILRAAIWYFTGSFQRANRVATTVGQIAAFGFILIGIFTIFNDNFFSGFWYILIGWFLQNAAASSYAQATMKNTLSEYAVEEAMLREWPEVPSQLPLSILVEEKLLKGGPRYYFVARDGYGHDEGDERPLGMLSLTDITEVPSSQWPLTPAEKVMVPWNKLVTVNPKVSLLEALSILDESNVNQLPVLENGRLVGILPRAHLLHHVRLRAQLDV